MKETGIILKEYYNIISSVAVYFPCDEIRSIERQVLEYLCACKGCTEAFDICWAAVEDARCLRSSKDNVLLAMDELQHGVAYDVKMDVLLDCKIEKQRRFDTGIFVQEIKSNADLGMKHACRLLACLNWLGVIVPQNQAAAQNIWATLAMTGERSALEMLIYGHRALGDEAAYIKWSHVLDILQKEQDAFSAIALHSNYPDYSQEELQTANLIMLISRKALLTKRINRPMLHYALHSKDDFKTKMYKLSSDTNFYIDLYDEDRFAKNKCGF